jgi:hypothetical protein
MIEVKGIDRDGESRSMTIEYLTPIELAERLFQAGWKFAQLMRDEHEVGGVQFSVPKQARAYWGEPE